MSLFAKNTVKAVIDPVCGMDVIPSTTDITAEVEGDTYYFCAEGCRNSFVKEPQKYLCSPSAKKKGIWGRYLARLERASGGKAMKCHQDISSPKAIHKKQETEKLRAEIKAKRQELSDLYRTEEPNKEIIDNKVAEPDELEAELDEKLSRN